MIAIPNMDKPKSCWECFNADCNHWGENGYDNSGTCPLIEIIPCKECKYSKIYALQSDAPMERWCHKGHFPKKVTDGFYCGDGERK